MHIKLNLHTHAKRMFDIQTNLMCYFFLIRKLLKKFENIFEFISISLSKTN